MLRSNRREFIRSILGGAAGLTVSYSLHGQTRSPTPITAKKLTERIVAVSGVGGNVGLVIDRDRLLMIDGGLSDRASDLAGFIAQISPDPVEVLFNTHYHFDHVGSNEYLGKSHCRIVAHANVKQRLGVTFENPAMGRTMTALSTDGLPTEIFGAAGKLTFGAETLEYEHVPNAHTDGDAFVFFSSANVLHTGDLLWVGRYPVIDYTVGGSLGKMALALERLDKIGDDRSQIIPGHGPVVGKTELRQIREMWVDINQRLENHARAGRSLSEVLASGPTKDFDGQPGLQNPADFIRQAYGGLLRSDR